jgi:carbonic anhydrase
MHDIAKFISGFKKFQQSFFCKDSTLFERLSKGQSPKTMVIACSDSRVDPAILTNAAPGDLFVIRNIGNLAPPYDPDDGRHGVSAALEFGVKSLRVEHIIILGHGHCGGIRALMQPEEQRAELGEFVDQWVNIAASAKARVLEELPRASPEKQQKACEEAAVLVSMENLLSFPWIKERVSAERLTLHGWYFDLERGELLSYVPQTGSFEPLAPLCGAG